MGAYNVVRIFNKEGGDMLQRDHFHEIIYGMDTYFSDVGSDPKRAIERIRDKFGLDHVSYLGVSMPFPQSKANYAITTYSDEWVAHYVKNDYASIDPVIRRGIQGILPVDWDDLPRDTKQLVNFFGEAREFGVKSRGLSVLIRGIHGESAMFSINIEANQNHWRDYKKNIMMQMQTLAYHFHTMVLDFHGYKKSSNIVLSAREKECLFWSSQGKSSKDTADILGIKETTVNFFLENCKIKLDCINRTQAVAQAVRLAII